MHRVFHLRCLRRGPVTSDIHCPSGRSKLVHYTCTPSRHPFHSKDAQDLLELILQYFTTSVIFILPTRNQQRELKWGSYRLSQICRIQFSSSDLNHEVEVITPSHLATSFQTYNASSAMYYGFLLPSNLNSLQKH